MWDDFVAGHRLGTLFHQAQWKNVLEGSFPHIRARFLALADENPTKIIAGLPLYEVNSWIFGSRLVCVPYSTWCDPLVDDAGQLELLLNEARNLASSLSSKRIEVRCRSVGWIPSTDGWSIQKTWKHHTIPLKQSEAGLWKNLSRTAVRRMVRKAEKNSVEVSVETDPDALGEFYRLFVETRRRLALPIMPSEYFSAIHEQLSEQSRLLLVARQRGNTLGAVLAFRAQGVFHLEFAADHPEARRLGVMQLLYWRALQLARESGCREFSLGRTSIENGGLLEYKRHWNPIEEDLVVRVWNRGHNENSIGDHQELARPLVNWLLNTAPRPLSKLLGAYVYRHWG